MRRLVVLPVLVVGLALSGCASSTVGAPEQTASGRPAMPASSATARIPSLTAGGRLLEQFEGLLHARYGAKSVCARIAPRGQLVFVANGCSPLARYAPYLYAFSHPVNKTLRLSRGQPRVFGNYPRVILIGHLTVRCDSGGRPKYLISYADTVSFSLSCQVPQGESNARPVARVAVLGFRHLVTGPYGAGWGTARPKEIYNGGDGGGLADHLRWRGWGSRTAYADGKTAWYTSTGTHRVRAELRASDLGRCFGKLAYRRLYERDRKVNPPHKYADWVPWRGKHGKICLRHAI